MNEVLKGIVSVELRNEGSGSEGEYAFLTDKDTHVAVRLCREDHLPFNDDFLNRFDNCEVTVEGVDKEGWFMVSAITDTDGCRHIAAEEAESEVYEIQKEQM